MRGAYSSLRSTDQFLEFNVPSSSYKVDHSMNTDNESCPLCEKDNALITIDDDICCKHCGFVQDEVVKKLIMEDLWMECQENLII